MKYRDYFIRIILAVTLLSSMNQCSKKVEEPSESKVLAKIDESVITVDEFIRRAEYTIRPPYCRGDNYIHKKIILNSLIAEKLFALEAGNPEALLQNDQYMEYIQGRKEQAMLQMYYHTQAYKHVEFDSTAFDQLYNLAGRTYRVSFFSVDDITKANLFMDRMNSPNANFESLYEYFFGDREIPMQEISWSKHGDDPLQAAMFSEPLQKGQILGPVHVEDGDYYLVIRVDGWTDRPAITETQINSRRGDVTERLTSQKAMVIYKKHVAEIMRGKRLDFSSDTFNRIADYLAPFYLKSEQEKKEAFNKRFWENELKTDSLMTNLDEIADYPLVRIDDETWTVERFFKEMSIHPLVFRKREISNREFPAQLRLAIVDMVQDKYVIREAYKLGLDKLPNVAQYTSMWEDNLLSMYQKNHYLRKKNTQNMEYLDVIERYLNPYIDSLQVKYHDVIRIDTDAFEDIQLTNIDMFVVQRNVPFPVIVPNFPLLTTDNTLDYGKKIE